MKLDGLVYCNKCAYGDVYEVDTCLDNKQHFSVLTD